MSDLSKPNHYFHDSLGDPATCTGDHNHPEPETDDPRFAGMPAAVVDSAKKAECQRCKEKIVDSSSMTGTVFVNYYVPALGVRQRLFLCGACGLAFREFVMPELETNAVFQAVKTKLLAAW